MGEACIKVIMNGYLVVLNGQTYCFANLSSVFTFLEQSLKEPSMEPNNG